MELTPLASYGITGVCIALIVLIGYLAKLAKSFMATHMQHHTDAVKENTVVLKEVSTRLRKQNGN